ncbi:hypothetical protein [Spongiibacter marinus]|uniref:hypothetical protein n=1 Tax=Spongiibacter marinus TaxID=354246 RepID=UPI000424A4C1|nr:hypothetical protein [Spongiibacter marinus]
MKLLFLLFFWPSKLASLAKGQGNTEEQAKEAIDKIRKSYATAILTIVLLAILAILLAYIVNSSGGISQSNLMFLRFASSVFIAVAVLAKLSWEIQTFGGSSIQEAANSYAFQFFYKIGVVGALASLLINT